MVTGALASKFRGSRKAVQRRTNEGVGFRMKAPLSLPTDRLVWQILTVIIHTSLPAPLIHQKHSS